MFNFLRRLRFSQLTEDKAGRYALYAIGEITLVVFGILIALQINNWNESLGHRELERISLENLREDLVIQEEIINGQIEVESLAIARADSAMSMIGDPSSVPTFSRLMFELASRRTFIANKATFNNLGSTGNIVHIQDKDLQNSIIRYYQQLDYLTNVVSNNNLFLIDGHFGLFVYENGPRFRYNPDGTIEQTINPELHYTLFSQLGGRLGASQSILDNSIAQLELTRQLISDINSTLNKESH